MRSSCIRLRLCTLARGSSIELQCSCQRCCQSFEERVQGKRVEPFADDPPYQRADHLLTLQHAVPEAQERAVRLTGILMRNTDLRFRGELGLVQAELRSVADVSRMCRASRQQEVLDRFAGSRHEQEGGSASAGHGAPSAVAARFRLSGALFPLFALRWRAMKSCATASSATSPLGVDSS